jgi:hypothetical protein
VHTPASFLKTALLVLWLPAFVALFLRLGAPNPPTHSFHIASLCLLPLAFLTCFMVCSSLRALLHYKNNIVVPGYHYLDTVHHLLHTLLSTTFLPLGAGALGLLVLLPAHLNATYQLAALGLDNTQLVGPVAMLPAFPATMPALLCLAGTWLIGSLFALFQRRRSMFILAAGTITTVLVADPTTREMFLGDKPFLPVFWGCLLTLGCWILSRVAWKWHTGQSTTKIISSRLLLACGGLLLLGQIWQWSGKESLQSTLVYFLHAIQSSLLILLGIRALLALKQLNQEPTFWERKGAATYLFGTAWPLALLVGWFGWLGGGQAGTPAPLQHAALPFFLFAGCHIMGFVALSVLRAIHNTGLHPPNRLWLLMRPLFFYTALFLPLGLPGLLLLRSVSW